MTTKQRVNETLVAQARELLIKMHHASGVGHLGGNLSVIEALALVYLERKRPEDTVILSKGHSAGALYVCLFLGEIIDEKELSTFHNNATRLPGHPPVDIFDDIPFATGSLGHGFSLAAGMALAHKLNNRSGHVYCIMSDGEWQEGSNWEALWFSSHHKLDNLTIVIDQNGLQGFGSVAEIASMGDLAKRIESHGLTCLTVDGHDLEQLRGALDASSNEAPKAICARTTKGKGVDWFEGEMRSHYVPLPDEVVNNALGPFNKGSGDA